MISSQALSSFRSSIMAFLAVFVLIAGSNVESRGADVCRLPAASLLSHQGAPPYARSMFSSMGRASFATGFGAGSIQFSDATYTISETGVTATILVTRAGDLSGTVTVDYATSDGTATAGQDYGNTLGTLFWADGDGDVKGFTIPITDDGLSEGSETVNVTLSNAVGDIAIGSPGQAVLTIVDNEENFALSIDDVSQAEGNGLNFVTFTVSMSGAATQPVTVNFSTADGTATAPSDYTSASGQLTFAPGETLKLVSISINGDTTVEADESFTVALDSPTNAVIGDGLGTATLLNDDAGPTPTPTPTPGTPTPTPTPGSESVQFSSTAYSVNENVLAATITVTRTGTGNGAASVNFATSNGTATAGEDYTGASGTLNWASGDTSPKTFVVQIGDDTTLEANETVNLTLSNAVGAALGAPSAAVLTIIDNDAVPQISINDVTQPEGNALNTLSFTVSLSGPSQQTVSLIYSTENGTATAGSDYVGVSNTMLTFSPGEVSKQVSINILGDFVVEPNENFLLNINSATNAVILDSQGVGTLTNDDTPGTVQFQSGSFSVNEGDGNAVITITRTGGLSQGVTVRFITVDGTAVNGEDYVSVRTTVTFEPDQAVRTVAVPITNDSIDEPDETINLALESPTGGAILGSPINAVLTVVDNDAPPVLSVSNVTANEGNTGTTAFAFTVSLTGGSSQPVTVFYSTANGTAVAPGDYSSVQQGTITFEAGETAKQVTIQVVGDFNNEPNETFSLVLSGPVGATIGDGEGLATIVNDDVGGAFRFTSAEYSVGESGSFITITVQRTGGLSSGASVDFSTADGTALAGQDYTAVSGTLVFAGGQTNQSFVVPIANDGVVEPDESFTVILSNATGGGSTLGVPNTAMVFITNTVPIPENATFFDYDGDGRADLSVRRPSNDIWYLRGSAIGFTGLQWGVMGDRLAPADYDGDGRTDIAVFRPSEGRWYVVMSAGMTFQSFSWGANGDLPVPTDRNSDGVSELVVYRESNNTWYVRSTTAGPLSTAAFGAAGDKPVRGDFDGDGVGDNALFRPSNSTWYVQRSSGGFQTQAWGQTGDTPAPADFDGDGATDFAVFRPGTGQWFRNQTTAGFDSANWGQAGDIPVPADYDGDGKADMVLFRPSNGTWYLLQSLTGIRVDQFGQNGDVPTPSAFIY